VLPLTFLPVSSGGAGVTNFYALWRIPFVMPGVRVPIDTLFDTRLTDTLQLRITWGSPANLATGGTLPIALTNCRVEPWSEETTQPSNRVFSLFKEFFIEKTVPAANTDFQLDIPRGLWSYRQMMFRCLADGLRSDGIIQNVSLVSQHSFYHINRLAAFKLKVNTHFDNMNDLAPVTGILPYDPIEDGIHPSITDTSQMTDYRWSLDVLAPGQVANNLILYLRQVIPADQKLARSLAGTSKFRQQAVV
jgi:hypothetical protein